MSLDGFNAVYKTSSFTNVSIRKFDKLVLLVPKIKKTSIKLSINILLSFSGIALVISSILLFFKCSRVPSLRMVFFIFGFMLDNSSNFQPRSTRSKILFIILSMFTIYLVSDLMSGLTAVDFDLNEKLLADSIRGILRKNASVFCGFCSILNDIAEESTEAVKSLFKSCKHINERDLKNNEVFVIGNENAELLCYYENPRITNHNFSVLDVNLPIVIFANTFKKLSPFRSKFFEIEARFFEFGFDQKWFNDYNLRRVPEEGVKINTNDNLLAINLLVILGIGCFIALAVFMFFELTCYLTKKHNEDHELIMN